MSNALPSEAQKDIPETFKREISNLESPKFINETNRKVFERVWAEVEEILKRFRLYLFAKLKDHYAPIEKQEKIIT